MIHVGSEYTPDTIYTLSPQPTSRSLSVLTSQQHVRGLRNVRCSSCISHQHSCPLQKDAFPRTRGSQGTRTRSETLKNSLAVRTQAELDTLEIRRKRAAKQVHQRAGNSKVAGALDQEEKTLRNMHSLKYSLAGTQAKEIAGDNDMDHLTGSSTSVHAIDKFHISYVVRDANKIIHRAHQDRQACDTLVYDIAPLDPMVF